MESLCLVFMSSTQREIVVVQRRQGNVQKSDARAKLLFIFTIRFMVLQVCLSVSPFVNSLCYLSRLLKVLSGYFCDSLLFGGSSHCSNFDKFRNTPGGGGGAPGYNREL